jgi:hypothetical protein
MKKTGCVIYVFLVLSLFAGNVLADGNFSNETDNQTAAFNSGIGAKIRLLQLEAALEKNILWGEKVIAAVEAKNASINTTDLETLVAELIALKQEVNTTNPAAGDEAAKAFVDMRLDATQITKEFRESVHTLLQEADIQGIKKSLGGINSNCSRELSLKINQTRHEYNAQQLEEILKAANITDTDLLERVRNGTASPGEVKDALKDNLLNKSGKDRKNAFNAISEKYAKNKVLVRAVADKVAYKQLERTEKRLDKRLNDTENLNISEQVREKLQNRTRIIDGRMGRIENRTQIRIDHIGDMTDKKVENLLNLSDKLTGAGERMTGRLEQHLNGSNLTQEQRDRIDEEIGRAENRTERMQGGIIDRINKTQEKGEHLKDNAGLNKGKGKE